MKSTLSDYIADPKQLVPQGWYAWTHRHACGLFFHILLVIHPTRDEFTLEVGWSRSGSLKSSLTNEGLDSLSLQPGRFRLPMFWQPFGMEPWWTLVLRPAEYERRITHMIRYEPDPIPDCLPLVGPAVDDAGQKLKQYALPLFQEIVRRNGKAEQQ